MTPKKLNLRSKKVLRILTRNMNLLQTKLSFLNDISDALTLTLNNLIIKVLPPKSYEEVRSRTN